MMLEPLDTYPKDEIAGLFEEIRRLRQQSIDYFRKGRCEEALGVDARAANRVANALMILDDTLLALDHAVTASEATRDFGEYYFRVIGWLQVLFVQQDTVAQIESDLGIRTPFTSVEQQIRAVRNIVSGHPAFAQRHGGAHSLIARNPVSSRVFAVVSGQQRPAGIFDHDLIKLSLDHLRCLKKRVGGIADEILRRDKSYRDRFASEDLREIVKGVEYCAQKILEGTISIEHWMNIGCVHASMLDEALTKIENGLAGRADAMSFADLIADCRHALGRLQEIARIGFDDDQLDRDAYIFSEFLHQRVCSLVRDCVTLESEYKAQAA